MTINFICNICTLSVKIQQDNDQTLGLFKTFKLECKLEAAEANTVTTVLRLQSRHSAHFPPKLYSVAQGMKR